MNAGPSKEELQNYWVNNRTYFDSLAKYYLETDKEYYDEYIAPFYSLFRPQKGGNPKALLIIGISMSLLIFGVAAVIFMLAGSEKHTSPQLNPNTNQKIEDTQEKRVKNTDTISVKPPLQKETSPHETSPQKTPDNRRSKPIERIR